MSPIVRFHALILLLQRNAHCKMTYFKECCGGYLANHQPKSAAVTSNVFKAERHRIPFV